MVYLQIHESIYKYPRDKGLSYLVFYLRRSGIKVIPSISLVKLTLTSPSKQGQAPPPRCELMVVGGHSIPVDSMF